MGYTNVAYYPEGKRGWMENALPVEKVAQKDTPSVSRAM
jgi:hypothetical protein